MNPSLMGLPLCGSILPHRGTIKKEVSVYNVIAKMAEKRSWPYFRVENKLQNGYPDITIFARYPSIDAYAVEDQRAIVLIEAKILRKKELVKAEDDLRWQTGQIAFAVQALRSGVAYFLAVASVERNEITLYRGNTHAYLLNNIANNA